jgi:hypothetical protein
VKIPDLISPIVGQRVWRWDAAGLRSLNGKRWPPRRPLAAKCGAGNAHEPPYFGCTCGVYAAKNIEHLRQLGYEGRGIRGEVHLWGTVVEHELGWRAQHAYPKTLFLPPHLIPSETKEMEALLGALAAYDIDIFMLGGGRKIPLCRKGSGYDGAGLDYLIGTRTEYYARRQRDRTLMKGDRVAVLGRGIAVVEHADDTEVHVLLWNKTILGMRRNDIAWNRQNMRWEAKDLAP